LIALTQLHLSLLYQTPKSLIEYYIYNMNNNIPLFQLPLNRLLFLFSSATTFLLI
jgi:hypothetical protein